jgi:hypothetical protein
MIFRVGTLQRHEIEQRRGLQPASFDYNEIPTSSCQSFCWKARQSFDVPFFCVQHGLTGHAIASRLRALAETAPPFVRRVELH